MYVTAWEKEYSRETWEPTYLGKDWPMARESEMPGKQLRRQLKRYLWNREVTEGCSLSLRDPSRQLKFEKTSK